MVPSTYRRIAVAVGLGGLLLLSPPAVSGGILWDLAIASGYVCAAFAVFLYVFPVRGDGLPHGRLLGLSQHRLIGWWTLGAAVVHVAMLLILQPSTGRYLLPSAPIFMWCGAVAAVLAAALVQTGLAARSAMRRSKTPEQARTSATLHLVLAALMVLTLCAHVAGSAQLVSGIGKTWAVFLLLGMPLAWFALRPRNFRTHQTLSRRVSHLAAVALIPLLPSPTAKPLLLEPVARPNRIAVTFPHESHISVNCVTCHHNYVDHTGVMGCIDCHRSERNDLPHSSESTFHTFCRDCHAELARDGQKHGPTRACSKCH